MPKLVVCMNLTLDGVMQAPGAPEEDPTGGFVHGGWSAGYWDDVMGEQMGEMMGTPFALLLGRKTYEIFAAHWPHATDGPAAAPLNDATKYVASRTLEQVEWAHSILLDGDVVEAVRALKAGSGPELHVHGSGELVQTLLEHNLVDELRLMIYPVLLGTGRRMFGEGTIPAGLELVRTTTSESGVIIAIYERGGDIKYGSFALEEPTAAETERRRQLADA